MLLLFDNLSYFVGLVVLWLTATLENSAFSWTLAESRFARSGNCLLPSLSLGISPASASKRSQQQFVASSDVGTVSLFPCWLHIRNQQPSSTSEQQALRKQKKQQKQKQRRLETETAADADDKQGVKHHQLRRHVFPTTGPAATTEKRAPHKPTMQYYLPDDNNELMRSEPETTEKEEPEEEEPDKTRSEPEKEIKEDQEEVKQQVQQHHHHCRQLHQLKRGQRPKKTATVIRRPNRYFQAPAQSLDPLQGMIIG